jgi:hypothetical protein
LIYESTFASGTVSVAQEVPVTVAASSVPRLEDGTPYFGGLGELAYDPDEDRVQCHLCGEWFRFVGGSHLRRTSERYRI